MPEIVAVNALKDNYIWTLRGHTRAHIAYYGAGALFCGDTLFACGCGRLPVRESNRAGRPRALGARLSDPVRVFAAIGDWKNRF